MSTWKMKIWKRKAKRMSPAFRMMLTFEKEIRGGNKMDDKMKVAVI